MSGASGVDVEAALVEALGGPAFRRALQTALEDAIHSTLNPAIELATKRLMVGVLLAAGAPAVEAAINVVERVMKATEPK